MTHIQPAPTLVRKPWPRATDAASLRDLDRNSIWNRLQRMAEELEAQNADRECRQSRGDERTCASGKHTRGVEWRNATRGNVNMTSSTETLRQIEARHNAASGDWFFDCNGGVTTLTAVDHGTIDATLVATMATAHNPADAEFLACAHNDVATLRAMVRRAADIINAQKSAENPAPTKTKAPAPTSQRAAIAMGYGMFWKFMQEVHGLTFKFGSDKKEQQAAVDDAVRKTLNIASRRELDTDPAAAKRWNSLNNDYWNWKKTR